MAADSAGNDILAVGIPLTGRLGIAPAGNAIPTPVEGGVASYTLPVAYKRVGLLTEDGGFSWTMESDGDPIEFWQSGYSIPSGLAKCELVVKLAQTDETVRSIIYGKTADVNHYITIDAGGSATTYVLFAEEIFKNGVIRRRIAPVVTVQSVKEDTSKRGEVLGYEVTFKVQSSPLVANGHIGEWLIPTA